MAPIVDPGRRLTVLEARQCAREFIRGITKPDRQWRADTVNRYLPRGWLLSDCATADDFFPVTVGRVASSIRALAFWMAP